MVDYKILVKFPSRSRPDIFFRTLSKYRELSVDKSIRYLVSLDRDDPSSHYYIGYTKDLPNVRVVIGDSKSKVEAINRDMELERDWDILVVGSDDMQCQLEGWDERIKEDMNENHPDLDGVLYYYDGYQPLNTMPIMGRKYYDRFGYIYHPAYTSLFCDNEMEEVADILGKQTRYKDVIFRHETWFNGPQFQHMNDALMKRNQSFYQSDHQVYLKRKSLNFGL